MTIGELTINSFGAGGWVDSLALDRWFGTPHCRAEVRSAMRCTFAALTLLGLVQGVAPGVRSWNFEEDPAGVIARGFVGVEGKWMIVKTPTGRVLAQEASNTDNTFNVALVEGVEARDLALSVRIKPLAGTDDQGGGVVWRARNGRNYYVARYNPLEDNFRVYTVVNGVRTLLQSAEAPKRDDWRSVRVVMIGEHIECYLDGIKLLDVHNKTFTGPGRIGVWSKADARSYFDDLRAEPLDPTSGR